MTKKIALLGSAPSSVALAPFGAPDWELWACSPGCWAALSQLGYPKIHAWFELHRFEPGQPWMSHDYVRYLKEFEGPVYMIEPVHHAVPNCQLLPWQELRAIYGPYVFTSSLAWMFCLAMEQGATSIGLWGVDMAACPHPDTKLLTADLRWVRAGDLSVGQRLIAFDEEPQPNGEAMPSRRWREATVLRADRIMKPCYRLVLEDGREIICSDEHKWLTYGENESRWKMAKDLVTPHHRHPTRIIKLCEVWEEDKSWEAGYLAAAFDGEGHLIQKVREGDHALLRAGFAQRENAMSENVLGICQKLGFDLGLDSADGDCLKYSIRGGRSKTMEFLGRIRPQRLLDKFNPQHLGLLQKQDTVAVVAAEYIGVEEVVGLTTSTGTFIAEGLATHNTEEYGYQRAALQTLGQLALARGIEVGVPPESDLFAPPALYGVCEISHMHIKALARRRELQHRLTDATNQIERFVQEKQFVAGAIQDLDWLTNTWLNDATGSPYVSPAASPAFTIFPNRMEPFHGPNGTESPPGSLGDGHAELGAEIPQPLAPDTAEQAPQPAARKEKAKGRRRKSPRAKVTG